MVASLEDCEVNKHGDHLGRHLGFYQEKKSGKKRGESILRINIYYINTNEIPGELSTEKLYPDM